jgi:hypothetical protein
MYRRIFSLLFTLFLSFSLISAARAQANSGSISGLVTDPTGASIAGAAVRITNTVSGYTRTTTTDSAGQFRFFNIPFNPYRVTVTSKGFARTSQIADVSSVVPVDVPIRVGVGDASTVVNVEGGTDLLENDPNAHADIDRSTIDRLPVESASSELSSILTLASPGVAADSNGLFHGLGDHAENSFSVDGQPITDQQSKVFSNQFPADAVQSFEVIDGAPPAEYGDKTSLIAVITTRSGQGVKTPHGTVYGEYGSFGTANGGANLAYGSDKWGNFVSVSGFNSGRFLDGPEFSVFHDKGNEFNFFDRVDYQLSSVGSLHTNLQYTRSWFQTPNTYDQLNVLDQNGNSVGNADQRSKIETVLVAPTYTRLINANTVFTFGPYFRKDGFNYTPSNNRLADFGPIQQETVQQYRSLTNAGLHSDISYVKGINNLKLGGMYEQTFLRENLQVGLVDPKVNAPCLDATRAPVNGYSNPAQCAGSVGYQANTAFNPVLLPYDLTRGGTTYGYHGQTDVKQLALYLQDSITKGNWLFNLGIRGDFYNGLSVQRQAEPRVGISYTVPKTSTVLRVAYARSQETPFNENLVLSNNGCKDAVINGIFSTLGSCNAAPFNPGFRNEFHAGLQQAVGKHLVISGDYIWKYTHNAYDFAIFANTPIFFPIEWRSSKIPGFIVRANVPEVHNVSAYVVLSSVAARFYNPQVGGVGTTVGTPGANYPFRIDHDEKFNQTTHIQYALPFRKSTWFGFNWRYDSGLTAASTPCYNITDPNSICANHSFDANGKPLLTANGQPLIDLSYLTANQEFEAGLVCDGVKATITNGFANCDAAGLTSNLVHIPAVNTENNDRNPQRIQQRNLFDVAIGEDNLFHGDKHKIGLRITAINITNKYTLYNFLSTFSGTHYVSPRAVTGQISYNF